MTKFYIDESKYIKYQKLIKTPTSPFYKKKMKDVFVIAAAIGYYFNNRFPLKKRREVASIEVFTNDEKWIMYSIAVATTNKLEIILDMQEVLRIVEEYANAGIDYLYDLIFGKQILDPEVSLKELDIEISKIAKSILKWWEFS